MQNSSHLKARKAFASMSVQEEKPFDFLRTLFGMLQIFVFLFFNKQQYLTSKFTVFKYCCFILCQGVGSYDQNLGLIYSIYIRIFYASLPENSRNGLLQSECVCVCVCLLDFGSTCCMNDFLTALANFVEGVIAGGTAGVVVETALYPIDTIKTRLQVG